MTTLAIIIYVLGACAALGVLTTSSLLLSFIIRSGRPMRDRKSGKKLPGPSYMDYLCCRISRALVGGRLAKDVSSAIKNKIIDGMGNGNICGTTMGGRCAVFIGNADDAKAVLSGHYTKFPKADRYARLKFLLGDGLVTSSGIKWQHHRHQLNAAFHANALRLMVSTFNEKSNDLMNLWLSRAYKAKDGDGNMNATVHANHDITMLTMAVITKAGFGCDDIKLNSEEGINENNGLAADTNYLMNEFNIRMVEPTDWWHMLNIFRERETNAAVKRLQDKGDSFVKSRIEKKRNSNSGESNKSGGEEEFADLLDLVLSASGRSYGSSDAHRSAGDDSSSCPLKAVSSAAAALTPKVPAAAAAAATSTNSSAIMSDNDIRDHVLTFLAAGHETTSTTVLWVLYELGKIENKHILKKCHECVDSAVKPNNATMAGSHVQLDISYELATGSSSSSVASGSEVDSSNNSGSCNSNLNYLQQVIKETLRLHPPVALLSRTAAEDSTIGEYVVPPGTQLVVSIYSVHTHPSYWPQPMQFDPERFSPENIRKTVYHPFMYIPFSAGPRNCIGQRFAIIEATVILTHILYWFNIELVENGAHVTVEETVTRQPKNLYCRLAPRKNL